MRWLPRASPLAPRLVLAEGAVASALAQHLVERLADGRDAMPPSWSALASKDLLVIAAPESELPWIDGVIYLGVDPSCPRLRLPTALVPDSAPLPLFERALLREALARQGGSSSALTLALWPSAQDAQVLPLSGLAPFSGPDLARSFGAVPRVRRGAPAA